MSGISALIKVTPDSSIAGPPGVSDQPHDCLCSACPCLAPRIPSKSEGSENLTWPSPKALELQSPGGGAQVSGLQRGHLSSLCRVNSCALEPIHSCDHGLPQHLEGNPPRPSPGVSHPTCPASTNPQPPAASPGLLHRHLKNSHLKKCGWLFPHHPPPIEGRNPDQKTQSTASVA